MQIDGFLFVVVLWYVGLLAGYIGYIIGERRASRPREIVLKSSDGVSIRLTPKSLNKCLDAFDLIAQPKGIETLHQEHR